MDTGALGYYGDVSGRSLEIKKCSFTARYFKDIIVKLSNDAESKFWLYENYEHLYVNFKIFVANMFFRKLTLIYARKLFYIFIL